MAVYLSFKHGIVKPYWPSRFSSLWHALAHNINVSYPWRWSTVNVQSNSPSKEGFYRWLIDMLPFALCGKFDPLTAEEASQRPQRSKIWKKNVPHLLKQSFTLRSYSVDLLKNIMDSGCTQSFYICDLVQVLNQVKSHIHNNAVWNHCPYCNFMK